MTRPVRYMFPDWLSTVKNEWVNINHIKRHFNLRGRCAQTWAYENKTKLELRKVPAVHGNGFSRFTLVKRAWMVAVSQGLEVVPPWWSGIDHDVDLVKAGKTIHILKQEIERLNARPATVVREVVTHQVMVDDADFVRTVLGATEIRPTPGVYFLMKGNDLVYVGQSINAMSRMVGHQDKEFTHARMIEVANPEQRHALEKRLIRLMQPTLNIALK